MTDYKIYQGDALTVLRSMESETVQCAITSPPYFGLRSYQTDPVIWGNEFCEHIWGETLPFAKQDNRTAEQKAAQGATVGSNINFNDVTTTNNSGSFCQLCNAWRGELGLEPTFQLYIEHLIQIFAEVKRVLKSDGVCWVNLGDSYATHAGGVVADPMRASGLAGTKHQEVARKTSALGQYKKGGKLPEKCLMNIPARFAIAMTDELQMIQRNEIIWHKPACMPSSAKDRFTVDFEPIFFFAKNPKYKFNQQLEPLADVTVDRISQPNYANQAGSIGNGGAKTNGNMKAVIGSHEGRNKRTTWRVAFEPSGDAHYASYPTKLVEPMIFSGTDEGDTVLDIFAGTGTTLLTALRNKRNAVGIELNPAYIEIAERRLSEIQTRLF